MTIDPELVTRKALLMLRDLGALREIAAKGLDAYLQNRIEQAMVERYLERIVSRMIDINYHVITESGQAPPSDYHASFTRLADLGIVDFEFSSRIARSAGLRNRLVHEYDEIDPRRVFEALQAGLADIPAYLEKVQAHVAGLRA